MQDPRALTPCFVFCSRVLFSRKFCPKFCLFLQNWQEKLQLKKKSEGYIKRTLDKNTCAYACKQWYFALLFSRFRMQSKDVLFLSSVTFAFFLSCNLQNLQNFLLQNFLKNKTREQKTKQGVRALGHLACYMYIQLLQ